MLTGDNNEVATNIAKSIGINHVISDVLPKEKVNVITNLISPVTIILIKKNTQPTSKLIKVALIADVFLPSSPFIKASNAVDVPANIANIIYCNLANTIPPYVVILKYYDTIQMFVLKLS